MPYLKLKQLPHKDLYITSFENYADLKAAKTRAEAKGLGIGYAGKAADIKEYQANRWVHSSNDNYRNYTWDESDRRSTNLTALSSLQTAIQVVGGYEWVLIWQQ